MLIDGLNTVNFVFGSSPIQLVWVYCCSIVNSLFTVDFLFYSNNPCSPSFNHEVGICETQIKRFPN